MPRAIASVARPKRSRPEGRKTNGGRMPVGDSMLMSLRRAMRDPPLPGGDGCGIGAHGFRVSRGTSPVIRQEVVEDVVDGHPPDEPVLLVDDGKRDQLIRCQ